MAQWELALAPWRRWSAGIAFAQIPVLFAGFVFLVTSETERAVVAAVAYAVLEGLKWAIETEALRRHPDADFEPFYRAAPLPPSQQTFLKVVVFATPFELVALGAALAGSFGLDSWTTALFLAVFGLSWIWPLERVRRRGSWLAMTRLPSRPTRLPKPKVDEREPRARVQRSRGRAFLRWTLIVLLPFAIVALLFVLIALITN